MLPSGLNRVLFAEFFMKRRDEGKTSLVEFLRSIKFTHDNTNSGGERSGPQFAGLNPRVRQRRKSSSEESQLIRSAN